MAVVEAADAAPEPLDATVIMAAAEPACPEDMVEVRGAFCPDVVQECLRWIDKEHKNKLGVVDPNMCEKFRRPSKCISARRVPMHFCVDRYEWPNIAGALPESRMSWLDVRANCEAAGKRLCTEDEWTFACEGPDSKPYPYGDGYHRDAQACNADQSAWTDPWLTPFEKLDHRSPSGAHASCRSDFGVYDMVGNVDEWVVNTHGKSNRYPWISGLKGGHWVRGVHNQCRYMTDSHEPAFSFYVTGARCCSDAPE
jgi:formylglycine-generating enzyme required for sulfatase activity